MRARALVRSHAHPAQPRHAAEMDPADAIASRRLAAAFVSYREWRGIDQEQLAQLLCGIPTEHVIRVEAGQTPLVALPWLPYELLALLQVLPPALAHALVPSPAEPRDRVGVQLVMTHEMARRRGTPMWWAED